MTVTDFIDLLILKYDDKLYYDTILGSKGDFDTTVSLSSSILVSLFTEKRAAESEVPIASRRRGWWGNETLPDKNFEMGSKLWLLEQSKLTQRTLNSAVDFARKSLQWIVEKGFADDIQINGKRNIKERSIELDIKFFKNGVGLPFQEFNALLQLENDIT